MQQVTLTNEQGGSVLIVDDTGSFASWVARVHDDLIAAGWSEVQPLHVKIQYGSGDHGGAHPIINVPDIQMPSRIKPKAPGWHDVHDRRGRRVK